MSSEDAPIALGRSGRRDERLVEFLSLIYSQMNESVFTRLEGCQLPDYPVRNWIRGKTLAQIHWFKDHGYLTKIPRCIIVFTEPLKQRKVWLYR